MIPVRPWRKKTTGQGISVAYTTRIKGKCSTVTTMAREGRKGRRWKTSEGEQGIDMALSSPWSVEGKEREKHDAKKTPGNGHARGYRWNRALEVNRSVAGDSQSQSQSEA